MLPISIAKQILEFLESSDFVILAQVNRVFYKASSEETLWKREAIRMLLPDVPQNLEIPASGGWKKICLERLKLAYYWKKAGRGVLT